MVGAVGPFWDKGSFLDISKEKSPTFQLIRQVNFGEGFTARVDIENKTENIRTLETIITCTSLYYNGVPAHRVKVTFVFCSCLFSVLVGFLFLLVLNTCSHKKGLLEKAEPTK